MLRFKAQIENYDMKDFIGIKIKEEGEIDTEDFLYGCMGMLF
jgi:hypothetical protein